MKFTVRKHDILDVLSRVQGLAGRKSNLAITSNILLRSEASGIAISATDLETGFEGTYPAVVESEGSLAISARKFYEIARDFPIDEIVIHEVENRWIKIGSRNIEYHIVGMNPEDFPSIPRVEGVQFFEMDSESLKKMIEKTTIVVASDDKRAHIVGVFMEKVSEDAKDLIRMVSTDGSRLSKVDYPLEGEVDMAAGFLIPKKGLAEVGKFLQSEGRVQVGCKENHFIVKKNKEVIIIRLLDGEFPEYKEIISKKDGNCIELNRQMFLMMLKRMSILSSDSYKGVIFNFSDDRLVVSSTNPDIGESKEEMPIEFKANPIEVAFNPRFFIETLSVMDDETVRLIIADEEKPCLIEGHEDRHYLSIIMPMRL
ncbi:MAG: DNA polymerase III subunit beta [Desulfobacteraceae bacterium]|nr:MAG: DNA polymerase III subunit beta [Desulfobacteraceae bacterium]